MDELLSVLLTVGVCCAPVVVIGLTLLYVYRRYQQRTEGSEEVATALGLFKHTQMKKMWWYEGRVQDGRLVGLTAIVFPRRGGTNNRTIYKSAVRVVVEVQRERPLKIKVFRHENRSQKKHPLDSFDTAFTSTNGDKLTSSQQQALLDFLHQNPGTFWLADREAIGKDIFPNPEMMAEVTTVLLHEYEAKNPEVEQVREKTAILTQLAHLFEE